MVQMSTVWERTTAFAASAMAAALPIAALLLFLPIAVQLALAPLIAEQASAVRIVVMVVLWAIELTGTLALIVLALGATLHAGEAVRAALARLPAAIGIFVVLGIAAAIVAVPMVLAMKAAGINVAALHEGGGMSATSISPGLAIFVSLYALAYVVLIVWATARLLVVQPVILAERRGIGAIARAFTLTRGLTWRTVGVLILYAIVSTVAVLAAREVFGAIFGLIASGNRTITPAGVLTAIVVAVVSAGFKGIAALFIGKLYQAIGTKAERRAEA